MQLGQRLIPLGVDFDTSPVAIKSDKAYFLKGVDTSWVINQGTGQNALELKPSESNYLYCSVELPAGINTAIGFHYYKEANEGYVVVYNSNLAHVIYRLRAIDEQCQTVYRFCGGFPGITEDPADYFAETRMTIKSLCRYKLDGTKELYKELYLVNGKVDNLRIVIEDAIATNGFTTNFFRTTDYCCGDLCRIIKSGVPTPMQKITVLPIIPTEADRMKTNTMLYKMFQFRFVDENAWGQRSEHGLISEQYFVNLAGCSRDSTKLPHCVWLVTKKPCPEIVRRTVEVRTCELKNAVIGTDGNLFSDWKEAFHFDFYDQTDPTLKWYERSYDTTNTEFEFIRNGAYIRIKFCNNRECKPIALADVRNENPAPLTSGGVASIGKWLAYCNNLNDLQPFNRSDIDKVSLSLSPTLSCEQKYSRIKVYAVVHNLMENQNNPLHRRNGLSTFGGFGQKPKGYLSIFDYFSAQNLGFLGNNFGNTRFEEHVGDPEVGLNEMGGHGQVFPDGVIGFRGRLMGTNFIAESTQYMYHVTGPTSYQLEKLGVLDMDIEAIRDMVADLKQGGKFFIHEFDFGMVPIGTYRFICNSHTDNNDGIPFENTSTYWIHTTSPNNYQQGWGIPPNNQKQIFIDTTDGKDYVSIDNDGPLAVIADMTHPMNTFSRGSLVVRGYVFESRDNKIPIELAEIEKDRGGYDYGTHLTDHHGFFFISNWHDQHTNNFRAQVYTSNKCHFMYRIAVSGEKAKEGTTLLPTMYAADAVPDFDKVDCNRYTLTGMIVECATGAGIEGIAVLLGRSAAVYTNSKGEFKVIGHFYNGRGDDTVIFSLSGACYILDCNCLPVDVIVNTTQPVCVECVTVNRDIGSFNLKTIVTQGYPHGSRIQVGLTGEDWAGRMTDIQTSEKLFMDFPTEQEQGNSSYPQLIVHLPDRFSPDFCRKYKNLTFSYSVNTNYSDFTTWAADAVDFIDTAGNKNTNNPTKVKIWYRSLNAQNLQGGLTNNNTWNILTTDNNSRVGDIVEFIKNGDGTYFPPNVMAAAQYDKEGVFFLVDYDQTLKSLTAGAYFKIRRPYVCEINKTFYEVGIPVNFCTDCIPRDDDGVVIKSLVLNGFSSYMIPRQIPVVTDVTETVGGVTKVTTVKNIKVYPFLFEHHSPSDTWGDHCNNGGRVNFINPYEGQKCDRNQVMITGSLNQANDGAVNYLHWFSRDLEYVIDEQGWGGIVGMLVRNDGQVLLVCEHTVFSFRSQDDRATVDAQGYVRLPISAIFTRPEENPSFEYGCQPADINTIRRIDSLVIFLDSQKQAMVIHDFSTAKDISTGIQSWLVPSIKQVIARKNEFFWHTCFDHRLKRFILTKYNRVTKFVVNDEIEQRIDLNESMAFNYESGLWDGVHYTPEYMGSMWGDQKDTQLFSFRKGLPWYHHNSVNPTEQFLNYFEVQCRPVIGVVTNEGGTDEKSFVSNEIYCKEIDFILERLQTSMGQQSRVYQGGWVRGGGISMAPYFCDTANRDPNNPNITNLLYDGDSLYGRWLKALYLPRPKYLGQFFLITAIISYYSVREKGNG